MTQQITETQIITEHEGELIVLSNKVEARVRPFNVEELFSDDLVADMEKIVQNLWAQAKVLFASQDFSLEVLAQLDLMAAFKDSKGPMSRCLARCINVPLKKVPFPDLPRVLEAFIRQNFSPAQLQSWAGLFQSLLVTAKAIRPSNTTSGTAASSSSTTDTNGESSLPPSSSTGPGGA